MSIWRRLQGALYDKRRIVKNGRDGPFDIDRILNFESRKL
jgi:hypothetical protein